MKKLLFFSLLILLALSERLWWDMGPNVELVTVVTLLAAVYLGRRWSALLVILVMGISDFFLGNTLIWVFTWSAFLMNMVWGGWVIRGKKIFAVGVGVGASVWFYVWTNFGVWLLDRWGMYSHDLFGLMQCYINGLPFLKMNLLSNMVIVPVGFGVVEIGLKFVSYLRWLHVSGRGTYATART